MSEQKKAPAENVIAAGPTQLTVRSTALVKRGLEFLDRQQSVKDAAPEALLDRARTGDADALEALRERAHAGDADAQFALGRYFWEELDDREQATFWFGTAAENGHIVAQFVWVGFLKSPTIAAPVKDPLD